MNLTDVTTLAAALMAEHDITSKGWTFRFDGAHQRMGLCQYRTKTISVSHHYAEAADEAHVRDTILHEIAHVLAGSQAKHGPGWKVVASRIGATPKSCGENPHHNQSEDALAAAAIANAHSLPGEPTSAVVGPNENLPAGRRIVLSEWTRHPGEVLIIVRKLSKNYLTVNEHTGRRVRVAPSLMRHHYEGQDTVHVASPTVAVVRTAAAAASTTTVPAVGGRRLIENEIGKITRSRFIGSEFTVRRISPKGYIGEMTADGKEYRIPFSMLEPRDGAGAAPVMAPPVVRLRPGMPAVIVHPGPFKGEPVSIEKTNPTSYTATVSSTGSVYRFPHSWVAAA